MLNNRKDKKINQKLTSDAQFLNYAKEDLELKRKLLDRLGKEDSDFKESMTKKTMETVGESISQSIMLLAQFLRPPNASHMPSPSTDRNHSTCHMMSHTIINHFTKLGKVQICIFVEKHRVVCLCLNNPLAIELGQAMILMRIALTFEMWNSMFLCKSLVIRYMRKCQSVSLVAFSSTFYNHSCR